MAYYNTCPNCGCNLDPGEKCDCESEAKKKEELLRKQLIISPKTGQMTFAWGRKEFGYATKSVV